MSTLATEPCAGADTTGPPNYGKENLAPRGGGTLPKRVKAPLVGECFANLECRTADTRFVNKYGLFSLEVLKAWIDPKQKSPRTIHHRGDGTFVVDGETIKLKSKMP